MYVRWKFLNAGDCVFVVVLVVVVAPRSAGPKVSAAVPRAAIPKAACTVAGVMAMVCCFEWYGASQRPAWWASSVVRVWCGVAKCCAAGRALGRGARRDVNAANRSLWSLWVEPVAAWVGFKCHFRAVTCNSNEKPPGAAFAVVGGSPPALLAQSVERTTLNRVVVGSSPT